MKKIVAFIVSAAFVLPTFALTVNVGDDIAVAGKTGSVTKIIDVDKTRFEMDVLVEGTTYTFGVTKDSIVPLGNKDYKVKNSWGTKSKYNGIWYVSENYVKGQSLDIILHKDALPKELKKKMGVK